MKILFIGAVGICVLLTGCGKSEIEKVQDAKSVYDQSFTNEQIFSNKNFCKSTEWVTTKDKFGRELVQLRCGMNFPKDYYRVIINHYAKKRTALFDEILSNYKLQLGTIDNVKSAYSKINTVEDLENTNLLIDGASKNQIYPDCINSLRNIKRNIDYVKEHGANSFNQLPTDKDVKDIMASCDKDYINLEKSAKKDINNAKNALVRVKSVTVNLMSKSPQDSTLIVNWSVQKDALPILTSMYLDSSTYTGNVISTDVKPVVAFEYAIKPIREANTANSGFSFGEDKSLGFSKQDSWDVFAMCRISPNACKSAINIKYKFDNIYF